MSILNIKGAVLDKEQLENYLEKLAIEHTLKINSDKKTYPVPRVEENYRVILKTYELLNNHLKLGINIHPAGEWLLDNFYIIEEAVKEIKKELPLKKYINFLGLSTGLYQGYARIYVLASEIVAYTDGKIDKTNLTHLLNSYQKKKTLNMDEIWNINVFFKIAIIEKIRNVCEKIYSSGLQKYKVENILERLIDNKNTEERRFTSLSNLEKNVFLEEDKYSFIEYMAFKLKKYGRKSIPYLDVLEDQVEKIGTCVDEVIKKEHFDIAIKKVSMSNYITSIVELQRMNFLDIFEQINHVEEILKKDPAKVYEKMDFKTKDYYRAVVKEISKKTKISEIYIAKKALELANENSEIIKKNHIGFYLIGDGKEILLERLQVKPVINNKKSAKYILCIFILSSLITILFELFTYSKTQNTLFSIIIAFLIYIPIMEIVIKTIQYILSKMVKPKLVPKLDFSSGIPKEYETIVVIPTIIDNTEKVKELFSKLEVFYLANKSNNLYFAVLGDCTSSKNQSEPIDREIIKEGIKIAKILNEKYPNVGLERFHFFYRKRTWNEGENLYLGWERKRGLLTKFNEYIEKFEIKDNEFLANTISDYYAKNENIKKPDFKYVITLDSDTDLCLNSGLELVGAMAHVLNKPVLNESNTLVVDGYGIMQPRVGINLTSARKSIFTKIFAGSGGTDSYTNAISDTYQDNFGEGIYTGKGIYDVKVFNKVLCKSIPENIVLSHDLLEGNYLRCALVSDILLMDGFPSKYSSFMVRLNRWIRGDFQISSWGIKSKVKNSDGKVIDNPLNLLSKFKILDNLRRSLLEICVMISILIISNFYEQLKFGLIILLLTSILIPSILDVINAIIFRKEGTKKQKKFTKDIGNILGSILRGIILIITLPFKAYVSFKAICKTIYRKHISKKHLLEWTTAEEAEKNSKTNLISYIKFMFFSIIIGIWVIISNINNYFLLFLGVIWILSPVIMWYLSKEIKDKEINLSYNNKEYLLDISRKTWSYFEEYMNEEENFLPPDNYQEGRVPLIVDRTSSTNIGLGFLTVISAYDLGFINLEKAINMISKMIETVSKLSKWNGHLYNWYNTKTLLPLTPRYISTVDSGNFVGYLYTLNGFLKEISEKEKDNMNIRALISIVSELINKTDFSLLYDKEKGIFSIGYNVEDDKLTNSYYDLLASEARQASLIAIAKRDISSKHWNNLSRTLTTLNKYKGLVSWSGTAFEYLMPNVNIPKYEGSLLDESCKFMIYSQQEYCKKLGIPWGISESAFNLKDLNSNYQYKAFGIPWLGLKRGLADEMVVSSYGSILAITEKPNEVIDNLKVLEAEGMFGKYGFYESLDYTPIRVPINQNSIPVKTYMAHHQALILLSINNLLNKNILNKRFMANPEIKTIDILLQEKMPENMIITKEKKEKIERLKYVGYNAYSEKVINKINVNLNNYNVISNGDYSVVVDERGNGYSRYKNIQINRFKETSDYDQGIYFYIKNVRTQKCYKVPYQNNSDNYKVIFMPDKDEFISINENIEAITKIIVAPNENVEIRRLEIKNTGNIEETLEVTSILEPILSSKEQDIAHPAFNNLFLNYKLLKNNSLLLTRNTREKEEPCYMAVNLFQNTETIGELEYEINKDKIYSNGDIQIPLAIKDSYLFSKSLEFTVDPIIALKRTIKILPGEKICLNLVISVSNSEREVKDNLEMYKNNENVDRCFELSKARAQEEARYLGVTGEQIQTIQKLFSYLMFNNPTKKVNIKNVPLVKYNIQDLWKYGISGDLPILLIRIKDINEISIFKEVLKAYEYLRAKNIYFDLVVLDEEENIYERYVFEQVLNEIIALRLEFLRNQKGGIFILNANEINDTDLFILKANIVIDSKNGSLGDFLNNMEEDYISSIKNIGIDNLKPCLSLDVSDKLMIDMNNLLYYNGYGGFSKDGKEYIIKLNKNLKLPTTWSHVLSNERFGTVVTSNMGGFTWSKNSRLNRLSAWSNDAVLDPPSETIYFKDMDSGNVCTVGYNPVLDENDYYVIYGFGYAKYIHSYLDLRIENEIFVPRSDNAKINIIKLENIKPMRRNIKIYYYIKPVLGEDETKTNGNIVLEYNKEANMIYLRNLFGEDFSKIFYISSSEKIISYTGNKREFLGNGNIYSPEGVQKVILSNDNSLFQDGCIAIELNVELESYEKKEISLIIGEEENIFDAQNTTYKFSKIDNSVNELNSIKSYWNDKLSLLHVTTPSDSMNIMLNGWVNYQTIVSRLWGRTGFYQSGGAFGFRDQLQDTLGLKFISSDIMKNQIIKHARHQFIEGDVLHWWHEETSRGIRTRFSDDLLWLVFVTEEYIEFTGNTTILDEIIPYLSGELLEENELERYDKYLESEIKDSLYNHLKKAIEKSLNFGEHGLPKIGTGDWNDGFSNVGSKGKGESVWLGFFLYYILKKFIPICELKEDLELANKYKQIIEILKKNLNNVSWDGRWFKRAFTDDGKILGSIENEECKIDSISQSWAVISKAGDNDKMFIAMESLENHLIDKENGIIKLLDPPFEKSDLEPGYIKAYLPGVRENGGQYTHAAVWVIIAEAILGFGDKAYDFYRMINPIEHSKTLEQSNKYKIEPYVIPADIYGAKNLKGRGGWSWYTGSSSWYYRAGIEYILGLKIEKNTLKIKPAIPREWKEYNIRYKYKTTTYNIKVKNPNSKNGPETVIRINGIIQDNNEVLLVDDGKIYEIEVEII